jgi:Uma2 family endonuclease
MSGKRRAAGWMSVEDYLAFEEEQAERHEYVEGDVYAMTGGTYRHSLIVQNISFRLMERARGGPCSVHTSILKVQIGEERIYYPDVQLVCGRVSGDALVIRDPCLVVEVTSSSTRRIDRREKLEGYRRLSTLKAYFIVEQRRRRVDRHWRESDGAWMHEEYVVDGEIPVPCIGGVLTLDEIYEGVELPNIAEPEPVEYG